MRSKETRSSGLSVGFSNPAVLISLGLIIAIAVPLALIPVLQAQPSNQAAQPTARVLVDGAAYSATRLAQLLVPPAPVVQPRPAPPPRPPGPPISSVVGAQPQVNTTGPEILALEERLSTLGYLVGKVDGKLDRATGHGIMAFQKVEGLPRTGSADAGTLARLDSATTPAPAFNTPPDHLEVDIPRQVVLVVRGGKVTAILPTSTGNNKKFTSEGWTRKAITPNGTFQISYKRNGWRTSPLGRLYRPVYFNGGIALHGSPSVPAREASHGCVRLPMAFADWFADNASPVGMVVYVYGGPAGENPAPFIDQPGPAAPAVPGAPVPPAPAPPPPTEPVGGLLGGLLSQP